MIEKIECLSKKPQKYNENMQNTINLIEKFLDETGFTFKSALKTQKLSGALILDPSVMVEYRALALEINKQIKKVNALTYMDVVSQSYLNKVIDKYPKDSREITMIVLGYDKETKKSDFDA